MLDIDDVFLACHPPGEKVKGSFNRMVAGAEGGVVVVERELALEEVLVSRGICGHGGEGWSMPWANNYGSTTSLQ